MSLMNTRIADICGQHVALYLHYVIVHFLNKAYLLQILKVDEMKWTPIKCQRKRWRELLSLQR